MKDPEEVARIEYMARVHSLIEAAKLTLDLAPYAYVVPSDHPIAKALAKARRALDEASADAFDLLREVKR